MSIRRLPGLSAPHAYSIMMFAALFCTLAVKFFHSWRTNLVNEYFGWILADIAVLLVIELVLAMACFRWPRRSVIRTATVVAAAVCTWSVMNAAWLIRTGTQILPSVLSPLLYDPVGTLGMVCGNIVKMPKVAAILFVPSAVALAFLVFALARPRAPRYSRRRFGGRIAITLLFVVIAVLVRGAIVKRGSAQAICDELRYNCQLRAVTSILSSDSAWLPDSDSANAERKIPTFDQLENAIAIKSGSLAGPNHNVVIVVLEGVQYRYTSLTHKKGGLTPYLAGLADQGVEFTNARASVPHTTKALFSLLTGRFPSASQDLAEAVPVERPYANIATILKHKLNYRTACFETTNGSFECWPGLIHNLGFDKFWAREDLSDPDAFVGYFAADEFSMLEPITQWIEADDRPFCLVIVCSVTHDPYEVPRWFATPAKEPVERYRQAVSYTDKFLAALDVQLTNLGLADKTIFCVIGDHGEAFGEHGLFSHERIAFDEVLRVPWVIRAPFLVEPGTKIAEPVSSIDFAPTLLSLTGIETKDAGFDGIDALGPIAADRTIYFACWMRHGPAGFVKGNRKFIYNPANQTVSMYDLGNDPLESVRLSLPPQRAQQFVDEITAWRRSTIFQIDQQRTGKTVLFGRWLCNWTGRVSSAHYESSKLTVARNKISVF